MATHGAFTFVLHSHLPYARAAGMWPHGEEWVHEAISETYLPLLNALHDLTAEGVPWALTIGITPILAEQLADPLIIDHFETYVAKRAAWAAEDIDRFAAAGEPELQALARAEHHWYARSLTTFRDRFQRDLIGGFRQLQALGHLDIATCAATHGFLPLLSRDSSIYAQVHTGAQTTARHFGKAPRSIWLPECAYRPAETGADGVQRAGLETFLAAESLNLFFSETHTVEGGHIAGKAAGAVMGLYGSRNPATVAVSPDADTGAQGTTYHPYWVGDAAGQVAVLARNPYTGQQVWSATFGYPGDFAYREFHRKDPNSGMRYWRIGGAGLDLGRKPLYNIDRASEQARNHAAHYVSLVEQLLTDRYHETGEFGVISAAYDTELFGHWWFEGVEWLEHVLRGLARSTVVELANAQQMIEHHPPDRVLALPASSWGSNGDFSTWLNGETEWMWPVIHGAERSMEELVAAFPDVTGDQAAVLNQTARELLLLQSSDWPFLITTGQAGEYATERFNNHVERFNRLAAIANRNAPLTAEETLYLEELEERDNPFPTIDYRNWAERQGKVAPVTA